MSARLFRAGVFTLAALVPSTALAQIGTFFVPAKILKQGAATSSIAGKGAIKIQVFVQKNGSSQVKKILSSTNPADNAAALEIAKSTKFKPASKDAQPVDSFYTYVLNFNGSSVSNGDPAMSSDTASAYALIRAGKYADAKTKLTAYVQSNPSDKQGFTLLGIANAFSDDNAGASAAFDKAGTIDPKYRTLASEAYAKNAVALVNAKQYADAIAAATRAIDLSPQPSVNAYYLRGVANADQQQYAAAIPDLEKARSLAIASKATGKNTAGIGINLLAAYVGAGQADKAQQLAPEIVQADPSLAGRVNDDLYTYYANGANALAQQPAKRADAIAMLESGAKAVPSRAADLYVFATRLYSTATPTVDWKAVKAEADKALAVDPENGQANFLAGIALANDKKPKDALPFVQKAKTSPLYTSDAAFAKGVDDALKQLAPPAK